MQSLRRCRLHLWLPDACSCTIEMRLRLPAGQRLRLRSALTAMACGVFNTVSAEFGVECWCIACARTGLGTSGLRITIGKHVRHPATNLSGSR